MTKIVGKTSKTSAQLNRKAAAKPVAAKAASKRKMVPKSPAGDAASPVLLSGGNPQIANAYGDAPVQAYIAARRD